MKTLGPQEQRHVHMATQEPRHPGMLELEGPTPEPISGGPSTLGSLPSSQGWSEKQNTTTTLRLGAQPSSILLTEAPLLAGASDPRLSKAWGQQAV